MQGSRQEKMMSRPAPQVISRNREKSYCRRKPLSVLFILPSLFFLLLLSFLQAMLLPL
jgi:hypothetical protein